MKISALVFALVGGTMAQVRFVPTHPGPTTPAKPILGVVNGGAADTINQISIESLCHYQIYVNRGYLLIMSPGVEGSWYLRYAVTGTFLDNEVDSYLGDQKVELGVGSELDSGEKAPVKVGEFTARNWGMVGGDIGGDAYDPHNLSYLKNTANKDDTIDVRLVVQYYYYDVAADRYVHDTAFLDFGLEYHRGQLIPGLSIKRKASSKLQAVAQGWQVPANEAWSLRTLDGRTLPLRREYTAEGLLLLRPLMPLRGVGVLQGPSGQSVKVLGRE